MTKNNNIRLTIPPFAVAVIQGWVKEQEQAARPEGGTMKKMVLTEERNPETITLIISANGQRVEVTLTRGMAMDVVNQLDARLRGVPAWRDDHWPREVVESNY